MKSKIVHKLPKIVLTYGLADDTLQGVLKVSNTCNVIVRQVMPSELDIKIKDLLKVSQTNLEHYSSDCDTCLLMCNFDKKSIDEYLYSLRSNHVKVMLKAVATSTNVEWSYRKLLDELMLEHQNFTK